jgi:hypothetical protein
MLIQQIRGNSSSAMARLHPAQQIAMHNSATAGVNPGQASKQGNGVNQNQFEVLSGQGKMTRS